MKSFIVVLGIASLLLMHAVGMSAEFGSPGAGPYYFTKFTGKNLFLIEIRLAGKNLLVGQNSATIFLTDDHRNIVSGAEVRVLPVMTAHGESTSLRPFVQEISDGLYAVENLYIDIEGNWTVKVTVRKDEISDSVSFDFPGVKRRTP
ncbi:MAG: FixH family protein [Nitrospirota bacterium]